MGYKVTATQLGAAGEAVRCVTCGTQASQWHHLPSGESCFASFQKKRLQLPCLLPHGDPCREKMFNSFLTLDVDGPLAFTCLPYSFHSMH